jgi:hypothetical protein
VDKNRLAIDLSRRKLVVVASNTLGEEYVSWESAEDPRPGKRIAYIARKAMSANLAAESEDAEDQMQLGELLGYPPCCVRHYLQSEEPEAWAGVLISELKADLRGFWQCNRLAYVLAEAAVTPDYFPCSLRCAPTRRLGREYVSVMRRLGFASMAETAEERMRRPLVVDASRMAMLQPGQLPDGIWRDWLDRQPLVWTNVDRCGDVQRIVEFE